MRMHKHVHYIRVRTAEASASICQRVLRAACSRLRSSLLPSPDNEHPPFATRGAPDGQGRARPAGYAGLVWTQIRRPNPPRPARDLPARRRNAISLREDGTCAPRARSTRRLLGSPETAEVRWANPPAGRLGAKAEAMATHAEKRASARCIAAL